MQTEILYASELFCFFFEFSMNLRILYIGTIRDLYW
jgi:hypothetical protein